MGQQGKPANLPKIKTLAHAINSCNWKWLCKKFHSDKPAPNEDNKCQQKSKKKPKTSSSNSTSSNNNKPAKLSASLTSISDKLISFLLRNLKDVLTTIFVCAVVVLATRLLTARKQPAPLLRLKPLQLWSRRKKGGTTKKRLSSPPASAQPEDSLLLPVLLWRQFTLTHLLFLILILSVYY